MYTNKAETFMKLFAQVNLNSVSSMETEATGVVYLFLCKMPCMWISATSLEQSGRGECLGGKIDK